MLAAGKGVRSVVLRLPMYVWGNNGSYFIPLNIAVAKQHGKAFYILPGWLPPPAMGTQSACQAAQATIQVASCLRTRDPVPYCEQISKSLLLAMLKMITCSGVHNY